MWKAICCVFLISTVSAQVDTKLGCTQTLVSELHERIMWAVNAERAKSGAANQKAPLALQVQLSKVAENKLADANWNKKCTDPKFTLDLYNFKVPVECCPGDEFQHFCATDPDFGGLDDPSVRMGVTNTLSANLTADNVNTIISQLLTTEPRFRFFLNETLPLTGLGVTYSGSNLVLTATQNTTAYTPCDVALATSTTTMSATTTSTSSAILMGVGYATFAVSIIMTMF